MADEDNKKSKKGADEQEAPEEKKVTTPQWVALVLLSFLMVFVYLIWPIVATKEVHLKDAQVYLKDARVYFSKAHREYAFPKTSRLRAFQKVIWNYEAAERAEAKFTPEDYFRNGYANYKMAAFKYDFSRYALLKPIRCFEAAQKILLEKRKELIGDGYQNLELQYQMSDLFDIELDKIRYMLGLCYLKVGVMEKSIPYFIDLQMKKHQYEVANRNPYNSGVDRKTKIESTLGVSPYRLQVKELFRSDLYLGKAYYKQDNLIKATEAITGYLESNRKFTLNRKISSTGISLTAESRFEALGLLGQIYWKQARNTNFMIKKKLAAHEKPHQIKLLEKSWVNSLLNSKKSLTELFLPEYRVYGTLEDQKLILAEVDYHLNNTQNVKDLAKDYWPKERDKKNRMDLWKFMAILKDDVHEPVGPFLMAIAGENSAPDIKLAALIILGNTYYKRGQIDIALGKLVKNTNTLQISNKNVYLKAAEKFTEKEFEENPFIGKMELINAVAERIRAAKEASDEDTAIRLHRFLLKNFTVPQTQILHQIAYLRRQKAREILLKEGYTEKARDLFALSAETFLKATETEFDKKVSRDTIFEAAESYFEGKWYSSAYTTYSEFIADRSDDKRVSKARHKKGISALYRKRETRFEDAKKAFLINISKNVRPVNNNVDLPQNMKADLERVALDKALGNLKKASRDIWAYKSLLELANVFYASHNYKNAIRVYDYIRNDSRFAPESEIWRKAAYSMAKVTYDDVSESKMIPKPWAVAIAKLEDVLFLYNLSDFDIKFSKHDKVLLNEFKKENAKAKFLLIKAYLAKNDLTSAELHAKELVTNSNSYILSKDLTQITEALYADILYELKKYTLAMEYYRRAHDRNLEAYERPFYSLNIVDCLIGLGKKQEAINRLKRTRWEFEKVYKEDTPLLQGENKISQQEWLELVDNKIQSLET